LLEDIQDNEEQMAMIRNVGAVKAEKDASIMLMGISVLSVFSALIDATSFFDRWGMGNMIPPIVSTCLAVGTLLFFLHWRNKSNR
jgi:hypothetical protein